MSMSRFAHFGLACAAIALVVKGAPLAVRQLSGAEGVPNAPGAVARQPGGLLHDELGSYLTIEGVLSEGAKAETGTLLVDTVNFKKLEKPISIVVRGAIVVNHNLQPARLDLPAKQRCILKGYESGEMIGVAPAVEQAAREKNWREWPMSPTAWRWRTFFVALVVVEPKDVELRGR